MQNFLDCSSELKGSIVCLILGRISLRYFYFCISSHIVKADDSKNKVQNVILLARKQSTKFNMYFTNKTVDNSDSGALYYLFIRLINNTGNDLKASKYTINRAGKTYNKQISCSLYKTGACQHSLEMDPVTLLLSVGLLALFLLLHFTNSNSSKLANKVNKLPGPKAYPLLGTSVPFLFLKRNGESFEISWISL